MYFILKCFNPEFIIAPCNRRCFSGRFAEIDLEYEYVISPRAHLLIKYKIRYFAIVLAFFKFFLATNQFVPMLVK